MITKDNIKEILLSPEFGFSLNNDLYTKHFGSDQEGFDLSYNATTGVFVYPEGVETDRNTTTDEHQAESYVVFLCIAQLFDRGYLPHHFKLEGRNYAGNDLGWCDILVKDNDGVEYLIIECKTADLASKDDEFRKHWAKTIRNGDQLFRYFNTYRKAKYLCLLSADYPEYTKDGQKAHRFENIYHIISLVDNTEHLKTNPSLKSFQQMRDEQGSSDDFFAVWKDTYLQDYNPRGLLEPGIEAFNIGNKSYGLEDLKTVDEYSLEKKYHEFALILRKHTISSHENAFDKLINLFIAKIIDETSYKSEDGLKLLWKGAAYDDYFSLSDRLNVLYLIGMKKFFNDEVAYVENKEIDEAFRFLSSSADEGKETIKKYFRKLKYFNNNPFAFLDVHNEKLFYQNAIILKDVISMLQDIYLTSNSDNQFLGDLFEGFLHKGVHQSEGQFFSPIPIVRFLVSSLPLKSIIEDSTDIPNAIDYACGSGHFLTEYARQITPIISQSKDLDENDENYTARLKDAVKPYFEHITGIEKDYRLSKVSQVAAYMYGMDGIRILYSDALVDIPEIRNHTYNVLVANPPYSVSGFLETLTEEERRHFSLSSYVSNIEKNNSIETFFIERSEQLLSPGGVATIILPASILSKGGLFMRTRELILKCFDIISICCFGPNTFGQTNTNTVALFLRRKSLEPAASKHFKNRVDTWFSGNTDDDDYYNDSELLEEYTRKMGYQYDDYIELLRGKLTESLKSNEVIQYYIEALNIPRQGNDKKFNALAEEAKKVKENAKAFIGRAQYRNFSQAEKDKYVEDITVSFIREIEKEKLYYFLLAMDNPQQVLIVQSPTNKTKEKEFLGYEWSAAKGKEGIHCLNTANQETSSDDEAAEDDTLQQIKGLNGIKTPLYNPLDLSDETKINSYIRSNFANAGFDISEDTESFVNLYSLVDLMDFSRVEFDKVIKTTAILEYPKIETSLENKEKLKKVAPYVTEKVALSDIAVSSYVTTDNMLPDRGGITPFVGVPVVSRITKYQKGDILVSNIRPYLKKIWLADKDGGCSNDVLVFRNSDPSKIINEYLYVILSTDTFFDFMMTGKTGLKMPRGDKKILPRFEVPIPSEDIQKTIVKRCRTIDINANKARKRILESREKIEAIMTGVSAPQRTIRSVCSAINPSKSEIEEEMTGSTKVSFIEMASLNTDGYIDKRETRLFSQVNGGSYTYFKEGDLLFAKITPCMENGKCCIADGLTNHIGFGSSEYHVFRANEQLITKEYLFACMNLKSVRIAAEAAFTGASGHRRVPIDFYENLEIPVPTDLKEQQRIASEISALRTLIKKDKDYLALASHKKMGIISELLNNVSRV